MKSVYWMAMGILMGILLLATANASADIVDGGGDDGRLVPEPASFVLLATGLVGLGIVAITRRRNREDV